MEGAGGMDDREEGWAWGAGRAREGPGGGGGGPGGDGLRGQEVGEGGGIETLPGEEGREGQMGHGALASEVTRTWPCGRPHRHWRFT